MKNGLPTNGIEPLTFACRIHSLLEGEEEYKCNALPLSYTGSCYAPNDDNRLNH